MDTDRRTIKVTLAACLAGLLLAPAAALGQTASEPDGTAMFPEPFTARLSCGQYAGGEPETREELDGRPGDQLVTVPLTIWRFRVQEVSDPRMDGSVYGHLAGTEFDGNEEQEEAAIYSALWQVVNDGGEWIGEYPTLLTYEQGYATNAIRLVGHGGYEGLYALIQADFRDDCGWDVEGYILDRDVPAFPVPLERSSK